MGSQILDAEIGVMLDEALESQGIGRISDRGCPESGCTRRAGGEGECRMRIISIIKTTGSIAAVALAVGLLTGAAHGQRGTSQSTGLGNGQQSGTGQSTGQLPSQGTQSTMPGMGSPLGNDDVTGVRNPRTDEELEKMRNNERQKKLIADTDRLLALANELKADMDKTNKDMLSLDVIHKADEIEKLAHSVKEKMKGS
jgi:hypothetical protein